MSNRRTLLSLHPVFWQGGLALVADDGRYLNIPWAILVGFLAFLLLCFGLDRLERAWQRERYRSAQAAAAAQQAYAEAQYYQQRAADIALIRDVLNEDTKRMEQAIQEEYRRFEAQDRLEADAHETAKRSLGYREDQ